VIKRNQVEGCWTSVGSYEQRCHSLFQVLAECKY